jgi:hypothetical protein
MGLRAHVTIALDVTGTGTVRPHDNCYGYNFNALYLLWFAAFLMKQAAKVIRKAAANVPYIGEHETECQIETAAAQLGTVDAECNAS